MAYEKCCKWAGACEFYFWRRQTSGCQEYIPPVAGVTIRSPERNHNQSEIHVMFDSGAGIRIAEAHGVLSVMTLLPPDFNETFANYRGASYPDDDDDSWFGQAASAQQEFLRSISQSQPSTLQYVAGTVDRMR
ncbi:hypothetical protein TELCIR_21221 [Teladorsagia circumcincta]|uniref:Uncharacterized protein n=1 Tax=Teladorsagia circumcincta TaxID=45464 RepID=A0A2G9TIL9_TELCI|nr:hypothetical protein TELCIR_21221 [Teladorsagia circumcincta]